MRRCAPRNEINDVDVIQRGRASVDQPGGSPASMVATCAASRRRFAVDLGALVDRTVALVAASCRPILRCATTSRRSCHDRGRPRPSSSSWS